MANPGDQINPTDPVNSTNLGSQTKPIDRADTTPSKERTVPVTPASVGDIRNQIATAGPVNTSGTLAAENGTIRNIAIEKLVNWLIFSILVALFPIILNALILFTDNKPISPSDLVSHGELLLISVAITADAMGDLIFSGRTKGIRNALSIGLCFIILLFSTGWFASLGIGRTASNAQGFAVVSLILFVATMFVSGNCKVLTEE